MKCSVALRAVLAVWPAFTMVVGEEEFQFLETVPEVSRPTNQIPRNREEDRSLRTMRFIAREMRQVKAEINEILLFLSTKQDLILSDVREMRMNLKDIKSKQQEHAERVNAELATLTDASDKRSTKLEQNLSGRIDRAMMRSRERFEGFSSTILGKIAQAVTSSYRSVTEELCTQSTQAKNNITETLLPEIEKQMPQIKLVGVEVAHGFKDLKDEIHKINNNTSVQLSWLSSAISKVHESVQSGSSSVLNSLISAIADSQTAMKSELKSSLSDSAVKLEDIITSAVTNTTTTTTQTISGSEAKLESLIHDYRSEVVATIATIAKSENVTIEAAREEFLKIQENVASVRTDILKVSDDVSESIQENVADLKDVMNATAGATRSHIEGLGLQCSQPTKWLDIINGLARVEATLKDIQNPEDIFRAIYELRFETMESFQNQTAFFVTKLGLQPDQAVPETTPDIHWTSYEDPSEKYV